MDIELNTLFKRMDLEPLNLELDKEKKDNRSDYKRYH